MSTLTHPLTALLELKASPAQKAYMLNRCAHEAARDLAAQLVSAISIPKPTRDEVRAMVASDVFTHPYTLQRNEIEWRYRVYELFVARNNSENALVKWAEENCRRAFPDRFEKIAPAFAAWPLSGKMRETLLTICVQMEEQ